MKLIDERTEPQYVLRDVRPGERFTWRGNKHVRPKSISLQFASRGWTLFALWAEKSRIIFEIDKCYERDPVEIEGRTPRREMVPRKEIGIGLFLLRDTLHESYATRLEGQFFSRIVAGNYRNPKPVANDLVEPIHLSQTILRETDEGIAVVLKDFCTLKNLKKVVGEHMPYNFK